MIILQFLIYLFGAAVIIVMAGMLLWLLFRGIAGIFGFYRESVGVLPPGPGKVFLTVAFILAFLVALILLRW